MSWKFWKRNGHLSAQSFHMERSPRGITQIEFGEMADNFFKSQHWEFFKLFCDYTMRQQIVSTDEPNRAISSLAKADIMSGLPRRVEAIVNEKRRLVAELELADKRKSESEDDYDLRQRKMPVST